MRVVAFLWAVAGAVWALEEDSFFDQHFPPLHPNCTQSLTDLLLLRQEVQLKESVGILKEILSEMKGSLTRIAAPTEAPCPGNFVNIGGTCLYIAKDVRVSWEAARAFCQDLGGDLAVLRDANALAHAIGYAKISGISSSGNVWLGGGDYLVEGEWKWVSGEDMPRGTPFWGTYSSNRQPSGASRENCAILNGNDDFLVHDAPCDWTCWPLCQVKRTYMIWGVARSVGGSPGSFPAQPRDPEPDHRMSSFVKVKSSQVDPTGEAGVLAPGRGPGVPGRYVRVKEADDVFLPTGISRTASMWLGGGDHLVEGEWRCMSGEDMPKGTPFWGIYASMRQPSGGSGENCAILFGPDDFLVHDISCSWKYMPLCQSTGDLPRELFDGVQLCTFPKEAIFLTNTQTPIKVENTSLYKFDMRVVAFLWAVAGAVWALEEGSVGSLYDQHFPPLHPNCTQSLTDLLLLRQEVQLKESVGILKEILSEMKGSLTRIAAPTEAPCPGNFVNHGGTCLYIAKDVSVNWEAARAFCQDLGGDLAVLRDANALAQAIGYAKTSGISSTESVWLGGRDNLVEGEWKWVSGEDMPKGTPFWGIYSSKRQPSGGSGENCAILFGPDDFLVHDAPCSWTCWPLCQVKRT
ncbi:uncharacterized protein LOC134782630 [Penaeus indicus]|uniref:uncharacterized protein LOC134782630 n=1 Tax=Penaeus indicus TaxID=29960 RepID=UPI00300CFB00